MTRTDRLLRLAILRGDRVAEIILRARLGTRGLCAEVGCARRPLNLSPYCDAHLRAVLARAMAA